jgi:uncharacterized protein (DUF362 family)/Pyruvate/2-oxoacid:ferredoxin oxidoreductase delta subunit
MNKSIVSICRASDYTPEHIKEAVNECLQALGGIGKFISPGQKVLLKPNLLGTFEPEKAVTTHPELVKAVAEIVLATGAECIIGDSQGMGTFKAVCKITGMSKVSEDTGVELRQLDDPGEFIQADNKVGRKLPLSSFIKDIDVIITLPKLKTHGQMGFTGALKNQYGLLPGSLKAEYHFRMKTREWLAEFVVDINRTAPVKLAIMDAVVGMEGNGPSGGEPRKIGCIMASADLTALDAVACRMVGINAGANPILHASAKRGHGIIDPAKIETVGVNPEELAISDFKIIKENINILRILPLPGPAIEWLRRHWKAYPEIEADKCIKCMNCRNGCPIEPPAIDPDKAWDVNKSTCIKCYCCHEFCPVKAIKLDPTWFERNINLDPLSVFIGRLIALPNLFKWKKKK